MTYVNSNVAREAGRLYGWKEKFWGRRYADSLVSDEPEGVLGQLELDFVMDRGQELVLAEAKSGKTVPADAWKPLLAVRDLAGPAATSSWLVHGGDQQQSSRGITALPWQRIERLTRANG